MLSLVDRYAQHICSLKQEDLRVIYISSIFFETHSGHTEECKEFFTTKDTTTIRLNGNSVAFVYSVYFVIF